ncbi:hypothetical protein [Arthrobacter wenxiniae]|jgi:hypothetical protein|uniref:Uncharacterized protein n=1 Tax=Arthrobacter wenxiniae TaxID=2713570 RepID=A0A7Y7M133_9MICC|nr:hypothetical protein [Arthrobacter wenxiniae]NVM96353.1 hypothetical protein [Arthrobacter wenxiniae]
MPLWQVIAIVVAAWLVAVVCIVVFMMGASRGRRAERLAQQAHDSHRLQPAHRDDSEEHKDAP